MASTFFGFLCRGAQLTGGFLALALDRIFEICISCSLNLITGRTACYASISRPVPFSPFKVV